MNINVDCFAYRDDKGRYCDCLEKLYCKNEKCSFYKTRLQFWNDMKKANKYNEERGIVQKQQ